MADKIIFLVDMQSFYASVEKVANPQYKDRPVVVAGDPARRSGVLLAACPIAKKHGAATGMRLGEALKQCPELAVVRPRMQEYINVSIRISEILERYSDLVEPYSIDEQFVDVTGSLVLFGDPETIARSIQQAVLEETGIYARVGIGPNKVLAKIACDNFAKKIGPGIFRLTEENMRQMMWPLPVTGMFGIGSRMDRHLRRLGIHTIGDLANFPLERLTRLWGIQGHVLWMTANGIDYSPVSPATHEAQKAIGHHMTLPRDYAAAEEIHVILLELSEEVCRRARSKRVKGETVTVGCRGADFDHPTGFHRQMKLSDATNHGADVYRAAVKLLEKHWDGLPVRSVGVTLSQFSPDTQVQLHLFRDLDKERRLDSAIDAIKAKYGTVAVVRAASLTKAGQAYDRAGKIGGHYK
ncbi:DNA polymerase IV [Ferviditalea candida]|uniref:DNA polymerase IV n=1 Tax=Ferviditalea candida TaxID=3108399 RepID=A0ABU5ZFE3_9BACL|nr:DNA polymerase IV [Paenibacillaceae bacterium T2]